MKRFRGSGMMTAGLALGGAALVVGGILTIARPDASAQDADRLCTLGTTAAAGAATGGTRASLGQLIERAEPCPVAPFTFTGPDGAPTSLDAFRGRVVLVNLWATWCPPCVREMPALAGLQQALGGPEFAVVAISQDAGGAPVAGNFLRANGLDATLALYTDATGEAGRALASPGLPVSVLIDREGREIARLLGAAAWDGAAMVARIRALGGLAAGQVAPGGQAE